MQSYLKKDFNERYCVTDVITHCITNNYEETDMGDGNYRLNPCPLSGSTNNAFSLFRDEDTGFETYHLFNLDFGDSIFDQIPQSGTAYDLIRGRYPEDSEIKLMLRMTGQPVNLSLGRKKTGSKQHTPKPLSFLPKEELLRMFEKYAELSELQEIKDYFANRGITDDTREHFMIGGTWRFNDKDVEHLKFDKIATYPCIIGDEVKHFRYRNVETRARWQQRKNSGGYWFYNENAMAQDEVWFVEGEEDVMMVYQEMGIEAVGIAGEFGYKSQRFQKLIKLKNKKIYLWFDHDKNGKKYRKMFINALKFNNEVFVVDFPKEFNDPDDCIRAGAHNQLQFIAADDFVEEPDESE